MSSRDVDDLLAEIGGSELPARHGSGTIPTSAAASSFSVPAASHFVASVPVPSRSYGGSSKVDDDLEDLLSMTSDVPAPRKAAASSHAGGASASTASFAVRGSSSYTDHRSGAEPRDMAAEGRAAAAVPTHGVPFGGKCSTLCLAPHSPAYEAGCTRLGGPRRYCDRLQCSACDFPVLRFAGSKWLGGGAVDYLFFRNHMPDEGKLSRGLAHAPDSAAYCCQCSWMSVAPSDAYLAIKRPGAVPVPPPAAAVESGISGGGCGNAWFCRGH